MGSPWYTASRRPANDGTCTPVTSSRAVSSATSALTASKSPPHAVMKPYVFNDITSGPSAPEARASSIIRVLTAVQLSKSHSAMAANDATTPHLNHSSTGAGPRHTRSLHAEETALRSGSCQ